MPNIPFKTPKTEKAKILNHSGTLLGLHSKICRNPIGKITSHPEKNILYKKRKRKKSHLWPWLPESKKILTITIWSNIFRNSNKITGQLGKIKRETSLVLRARKS